MTEPHAAPVATVEQGDAATHAAPNFYGVTAPMFIALAMIVVIGLLLWGKAHRTMVSSLDKKIARIREQLAEAEELREEAEALKAQYQAKAKSAEADAAAVIERARREADEIVAKAKTDAEALIKRRGRMAEEKIAAEEQAAIKQLRASAADAASRAAARLIAERHDPKTDEQLVDRTIAELAKR